MYHLKFYADCPAGGEANKLFCYPVHDGKHACDLLARFLAKSFRLRAAFLGQPGDKGASLPAAVIQFPSSVAVASKLLVDYPPQSDTARPTVADLDELVAKFPHLRAAVNLVRGN
jgi:hypothetical protein